MTILEENILAALNQAEVLKDFRSSGVIKKFGVGLINEYQPLSIENCVAVIYVGKRAEGKNKNFPTEIILSSKALGEVILPVQVGALEDYGLA